MRMRRIHRGAADAGFAVMLEIVVVVAALGLVLYLFARSSTREKTTVEQGMLCGATVSLDDFPDIEKRLVERLARENSFGEFDEWLKSQPCVESALLDPATIKTAPPQREFTVTFKLRDSARLTRALDVAILDNGTLQFRRMHESGDAAQPPAETVSCGRDSDCKVLYSSCGCEATNAGDPRGALPDDVLCAENRCSNSRQKTGAVCEQKRCVLRVEPVSWPTKNAPKETQSGNSATRR